MNHSQIFNDNELVRQRINLMPNVIKLKTFWAKELKKVSRNLDNYKPLKPLQK